MTGMGKHPKLRRHARPVDGDTIIRVLSASVVLAVAVFAAVVSYSHIFDLGRSHGQDGVAARLLPLSVDGLIAAASLVMLHAARNRLPVPRLARFMLALGVVATVGANVAYGAAFGLLGAVVSAWPAVAFVGSVEMAVKFVRDARHVAIEAVPDAVADAPDVVTESAIFAATEGATENDSVAATTAAGDDARAVGEDSGNLPVEPSQQKSRETPQRRQPPSRSRQNGGAGRGKAVAIMKRNPGLSDVEVARRAGVSERTVQRARQDLAAATVVPMERRA